MTKKRYKTNDIFFSKKHNKLFKVNDAKFIESYRNGVTRSDEWLYNCFYLDQRTDTQYVNYYESRIDTEAVQLENGNQSTEILKALFGRDED